MFVLFKRVTTGWAGSLKKENESDLFPVELILVAKFVFMCILLHSHVYCVITLVTSKLLVLCVGEVTRWLGYLGVWRRDGWK